MTTKLQNFPYTGFDICFTLLFILIFRLLVNKENLIETNLKCHIYSFYFSSQFSFKGILLEYALLNVQTMQVSLLSNVLNK